MKRILLCAFLLGPVASAAQFTFVHADVQSDGKPVVQGALVKRGSKLTTGDGARVEVRLAKHAWLLLEPKSQLVLADKHGDEGLQLLRGVMRLHSDEPRAVLTPGARLMVSGETLITVEDLTTHVSVMQGTTRFLSGNAEATLVAGFTSKADRGDPPRKPSALPAAPGWKSAPATLSLTTGSGAQLQGELERTTASRWRVQLAADAAFHELRSDEIVKEPRFDPPPLPPGSWYARAAALDARGEQGDYSEVATMRVMAPAISDEKPGYSRFEAAGLWCSAGEDSLQKSAFSIDRRRPQTVHCALDQSAKAVAELELRPLPITYKFQPRVEYSEPGYARVSVLVHDMTGDPAVGRTLVVSGDAGVRVRDVREISYPGMYVMIVEWPAGSKALPLFFAVEGEAQQEAMVVALP